MLTLVRWLSCLLACFLGMLAAAAQSQEFPSKPIRIVVAGAPGDGTDLVARAIGTGMSKALAQTVVIENMPGASGLVAGRYVAKQAAPDGYTLLVTATTTIAAPVFFKDAGLNLLTDLAPVAMLVESPVVLYTNYNAPWKSLGELASYAKANPGKLNFGSFGAGDATTLFIEAINQKYGIQVVNIPYKSAVSYMQALAANDIHLIISGIARLSTLLAQKNGRGLAVSGESRSPEYPDMPTFREIGIPEIKSTGFMLLSTAGTPKPVVDKLNAGVAGALQQPEIRGALGKLNYQPVGSRPEALAQAISELNLTFAAVGKHAGIQAQ